MEVTGRENPAVLIIYNDGYFRYTEFVKMSQVVKEGAITRWDIDEHQGALYSEGLCATTQSFFLTKPGTDENGYIVMRMDGAKFRKKVEGVVKPKLEEVESPDSKHDFEGNNVDDEDGGMEPIEISI